MDFKTKSKNINFWVNIALSVIVPIGAYFGITGTDMTSWNMVIDTGLNAISNPFVCVTCLVSLISAIHNPNTKGFLD